MSGSKRIGSALISVYHKERLDGIVKALGRLGVTVYSTGGTQKFVEAQGVPVTPVEQLTGYPSILGGRVKTLHPGVFGGILARRDNQQDQQQLREFAINEIDLVIVDLYPFEDTVAQGASHADIIEKIDIGGISLIRAAAKNYQDVVIVASQAQYGQLERLLAEKGGCTDLEDRLDLARQAFGVSSHYDAAIFDYFDGVAQPQRTALRLAVDGRSDLRYGENPHQAAAFHGQLGECFEQLHGKEISYNNLLDLDAAIGLIDDFGDTTLAILKHNNACGVASRPSLLECWRLALAADPESAFGGIVVANANIDEATAAEMNKIFFEVVIAPSYDAGALETLRSKKNRIILVRKPFRLPVTTVRSCLNGVLRQERDRSVPGAAQMDDRGGRPATPEEKADMAFAQTLVKHTKSNAIVLARNEQLLGSGMGQTSRVNALKHAIEKARHFNLDLRGAVMASDAFFPFGDCAKIAHEAGITAIVEPGGSIRDNETIEYCQHNALALCFTGVRHFKH